MFPGAKEAVLLTLVLAGAVPARAADVYAVKPGALKIEKLFGNSFFFGRKSMVVVTCTPATPAGLAIAADLRWAVGVALARYGVASNVTEVKVDETQPGCPGKEDLRHLMSLNNAEYVALIDLKEEDKEDGYVPVDIKLINDDGKAKHTYSVDRLVVVGEEGGERVENTRSQMRFYRSAWRKDYRVITTRMYQRGMLTSMSTTRIPLVRDESNKILEPEEVMAAPGMEDVKGTGKTVSTLETVVTALNFTRWGVCLAGPAVGCVGGLVVGVPLALVGVATSGPQAAAALGGFPLLAGIVAGCLGGLLGLCVLSGVQDVVSFPLAFARAAFVDSAINKHNKGLAEEVGIEPKDVDEAYFP